MTAGLLPVTLLAIASATAATAAPGEQRDDVGREHKAPTNLVFLEPLGNGLLYSLDYERLLAHDHVGLRVGASWFSWSVSDYGGSGKLTLVSFPIVGSYYVGTQRHKLQVGLGATILYTVASTDTTGTAFGNDRTGLGVAATAVLGYRYLPPDGGFTFGTGFTPLWRPGRFLPWGGVDAGWAF